MLDKIQFSLPLWPGLSPLEIQRDVYPFLEECGDLIADLYYTSRIAPFKSDAMGGILIAGEDQVVGDNALVIGERFGIPISPTFNNIHLPATYANYQIFVESFQALYDKGVRVITIPHTSWLGFGLKDKFPDLIVKNTILHHVTRAAEGALLFEVGFDYLNLDRTLMRDERALKEWKTMKDVMQAKLGRPLYLSLLYNEMCQAHCPVQQDHYSYNINRTEQDQPYFESEMVEVSPCKQGKETHASWVLKSASIPSYYSMLDHLGSYVDCFKMHGRESKETFYLSMNIIRQFKRRELINDPFRQLLGGLDKKKVVDPWLLKIRNCRFNCWRCTDCDDLASIIETKR